MLTSNLLSFFSETYSLSALFVTGVGGIVAGYLFKQAVIIKQKKKILNLEDEMLNNHSRILSLEKKLTDSKKRSEEHTSELQSL